MAICDVNSKIFAELLSSNINALPNLSIKTNNPEINSALTIIEERVIAKVRTILNNQLPDGVDDEERTKQICSWVGAVYQQLKDSHEIDTCFSKITDLANNLSTSINQLFNTLSYNVTSDVQELNKQIEEDTQDILEQNGINTDGTLAEPNMYFKRCNWNKLINEFGGPEVIGQNYSDVTHMAATFNVDDAAEAGDSYVNDEPDISIDSETADDSINRVAEATGEPKEVVTEMYTALTRNYTKKNMFYELYLGKLEHGDYAGAALSIQSHISRMQHLVDGFRKTPLNVPNKVFDQIHANVDKMQQSINLAVYAYASIRKKYNDVKSVLITEDLANEDVLDTAAEEGTPVDEASMYTYVHAYYGTDGQPFPKTGIRLADIQTGSKAAKAMYDEKRQAKLNNAAHYQRKATLDAAENVCLEYLKHIDTKFIPKGLSVNDFVKGNERHVRKLAKNLFSTNDNNLQSSLYEFVLDTKYPGTVLKDVHHRFGALAQKAVSSAHEGENVSNEALNMINNEVAAEMSTNFINDKLFR